jgi:hypothetical protein
MWLRPRRPRKPKGFNIMNWDEKLLLKRSLILAGFWDEQDKSNPTSEDAAAGLLLQKMERMLVQGAYLYFPQDSVENEVRVIWDRMTSVLARGEDLHATICQAALELPAFLQRHPECAAPDRAVLETGYNPSSAGSSATVPIR